MPGNGVSLAFKPLLGRGGSRAPLRVQGPAYGQQGAHGPGNGLNGAGVQADALSQQPTPSNAEEVTNDGGDDGGVHS
jgi:hypothetical protein